MDQKSCCFFGHRNIERSPELIECIENIVERLILEENISVFLFGSRSSFDELCHRVVSKLREKFPQIVRIYVRAEYEQISNRYKTYLLQEFEDTYYPPKIKNAGKAVYVERNREMIEKSNVCIVYLNESAIAGTGAKSGTKIAVDYARKKQKRIINIFDERSVGSGARAIPDQMNWYEKHTNDLYVPPQMNWGNRSRRLTDTPNELGEPIKTADRYPK